MPAPPLLMAIPNVSEGTNAATITAIGDAITRKTTPDQPESRLLDVHFDRDHHRAVFTVAAPQGTIADAMLRCAKEAVQRIDVISNKGGQHPHVGAIDVVPVVYFEPHHQGAACAEALVIADRIATELEVPVFLYGDLTEDEDVRARTRAELRRGGPNVLKARMEGSDPADPEALPLRPDFGPPHMHPTAGATLVAARPPLVAFNLQLAPPATLADASRIAILIREGGEQGMPGLRAIAIELHGNVPQVSMNVERPFELSLAEIVKAVARHAPIASAQLVGLAPRAAFDGFPAEVPIPGFDPSRHLIENALGL